MHIKIFAEKLSSATSKEKIKHDHEEKVVALADFPSRLQSVALINPIFFSQRYDLH